MKVLVVGGGSIGTRHLHNLEALGIENRAVVEPDAVRRSTWADKKSVRGFASLGKGLAWEPDTVVVASPSHLHARQALEAAYQECHLFVEKPLSHNAEGLNELVEVVKRNKLITIVGCNMRFHPGPAKVKELLQQRAIGRVHFARVHAGSYLPEWRPDQNYAESYSANAQMGGGCLLDCIHEIDLTRWYLGHTENLFCLARRQSQLALDVEDVAALICEHTSGALSEIHLDYVQRTYERGCQIVGERGSIFWDYRDGRVQWFDAETKVWTAFTQPEAWEPNDMYIDEMQHFLNCVQKRRSTMLPIEDAVNVMHMVFAAKTSSQRRKMVSVEKTNPA